MSPCKPQAVSAGRLGKQGFPVCLWKRALLVNATGPYAGAARATAVPQGLPLTSAPDGLCAPASGFRKGREKRAKRFPGRCEIERSRPRPGESDPAFKVFFKKRLFGKRSASGRRRTSGSCGQPTHPVGAVHTFRVWAGGLSTAGVSGQRCRRGPRISGGQHASGFPESREKGAKRFSRVSGNRALFAEEGVSPSQRSMPPRGSSGGAKRRLDLSIGHISTVEEPVA